MRHTCIDSFSGAGGLSLGLTQAGFDVIYSFDNDPYSIDTQIINKKYFTHRAEVVDIRELNTSSLMSELNIKKGELTLFAGGPPCQGFSVQRIGENLDERNNYVFVYMQKMIEFSPKYFLMENVPGINGTRGKAILNDALAFAQRNGYYIHQKILDAQDYGVPQRRKRMIIVGERNDDSRLNFADRKGHHCTLTRAS
jgi:DNA (cytosine-5)-methyltransferase 1